MAAPVTDMVPVLLLVVLVCTMVVAVSMVLFVIHRVEIERSSTRGYQPLFKPSVTDSSAFRASALKRANCWLAIRHSNPESVEKALGLHNSRPCSWAEGWLGSGDGKLFVSPPVSGWVLVIGEAIPTPANDVDVCFRFLVDLSRKLGQVQFFQFDGIFNHHAWVRANGGRVIRAYAWAGETLWNQGAATPAEIALKMKSRADESADAAALSFDPHVYVDADKVHLLAAHWSVDPENVDERLMSREPGIVGESSAGF